MGKKDETLLGISDKGVSTRSGAVSTSEALETVKDGGGSGRAQRRGSKEAKFKRVVGRMPEECSVRRAILIGADPTESCANFKVGGRS